MTTQDYFDFEQHKEPLIFFDAFPMYKLLRLKRQAEGFTQEQLAKILGCGASTLNRYENGKRLPIKYLERVKSYIYDEHYVDGVLRTGEEEYYN